MKLAPSGIAGLDGLLLGGFPAGRTSVIGGGPGSGKTMLAMQFLVNGAALYGEPGIMISFEESAAALTANFSAMTWPLAEVLGTSLHIVDGRLPDGAVQSGSFDLSGLVAIASSIVAKRGVKRIAIDGIDALFASFDGPSVRRRELVRLLNWLGEIELTALMTIKREAEQDPDSGYHGLAEYAADGVVQMRSTLFGELSRRTLSVVKMRGAAVVPGTHAYVTSDRGIRVLYAPTRTRAIAPSLDRRASTGVERLDRMLLGGYRVGTTTLIAGLPGTSKTTLSAAFLEAGCRAGEAGLFIGFDEPAEQMLVDVCSVGLELEDHVRSGLLRAESYAAGAAIADEHFLMIEGLLDEHKPQRVVIDPVSALEKAGGREIADLIMEKLVVLMKSRGITAIFTAVVESRLGDAESSATRISTIADTWIHLSFANRGGERNRTLTIVKARGTGHSNQMREVLLSSAGIDLADVYSSGGDVLVGTARAEKEQQVAAEQSARTQRYEREIEHLDREAEELARQVREAQHGLGRVERERLELAAQSIAGGRARDHDSEEIHSLRRGDEHAS